MTLDRLVQAPFNCTMMGSLRGALDYYGIGASDAFLYGASGHAFVLNIHNELCPSGPYCWDRRRVCELLENVGLRLEPIGFFHAGSTPQDRSVAESRLHESLAAGIPCMLTNMEFQLITGTDDTGFLTAQPWACLEFPPSHLTFGTWDELGYGIHMDFHVLHRCEPAEPRKAVLDSLRYAVEVWCRPPGDEGDCYGMGPNGYANWRGAVEAGHGASHGNWWNGVVWAECRARAADYLREVSPLMPIPEAVPGIADGYAAIASALGKCADKELDAPVKLALLAEAEEHEGACVAAIEQQLAAVGSA
ncbi:MAG TPA: hypothetical protein PLD23_19125 [Armatimonadota bacterium]|nr:hypothetical protein [Armatimonadota bacterium]HQK95618.1 hypothetical protein [Armatimonadota bacterium]